MRTRARHRTTPTMPPPMTPEIGSKCVPKQVDRGLKEPKAAHDAKTIGRNQRLSQSCTRAAAMRRQHKR